MCIKQTTRTDRPLTAGWRGCACLEVCQVVPQYIKVCWLDNGAHPENLTVSPVLDQRIRLPVWVLHQQAGF